MSTVKHLAIIMDGNRRWAKARNLDPIEGHREGIETLTKIVKACAKREISFLTVYALSSENYTKRSPIEIGKLLSLMAEGIQKKLPELQKEGARIEILGETSALPSTLLKKINAAYDSLSKNRRIQINIALNYGGRAEILNAIGKLSKTESDLTKVDEEIFERYLYLPGIPDPDLVIRTGGQTRTSNFLVWQTAYSEWYFTSSLWPDFTEVELQKALENFSERKRNFGK
jgi:undecaprenyl diphosphate synthase